MGLDFENVKLMILQEIEKCKRNINDKVYRKRLLYLTILYIQLCNGLRVSESVDAFLKWLETGYRELNINVRKRSDNYHRLVIIPREVSDLRSILQEVLNEFKIKSNLPLPEVLTNRVKNFATHTLKINTHALRYAFITFMSKKLKLMPQELAKLTGHKDIKFIMHYHEKTHAEETLRKILL